MCLSITLRQTKYAMDIADTGIQLKPAAAAYEAEQWTFDIMQHSSVSSMSHGADVMLYCGLRAVRYQDDL